MSPALRFDGVTKSYGGALALRELTFEVPRGSLCGLVGANGAGKTTTFGVAAGLLAIDRGTVEVLGDGAFSAKRHAGRIGLMPQDSLPSAHLSLAQSLSFFGQLQGLSPSAARKDADRVLDWVRLSDRARAKYGQLSHGMRRRFSLAQALLGRPELILLDEPTSGLDPELVVQIRELLVGQRGSATLMVSSHILSELEVMCDHIVILDAGRCTQQGPLAIVTGKGHEVAYRLTTAPDLRDLGAALRLCTVEFSNSVLRVSAPKTQRLDETNRMCLTELLRQEIGILEVTTGRSLESSYLAQREVGRGGGGTGVALTPPEA